MKKLLSCVAGLLICAAAVFADTSAEEIFTNYNKPLNKKGGDFILNVGAGIDDNLFYGTVTTNRWYIPPVFVTGEWTVKCGVVPLGFGFEAGYVGHGYTYYNNYLNDKDVYSWNNFVVAALANYHINLPVDNLDVYAGPRLGAVLVIRDYKYYNNGNLVENSSGTTTYVDFWGGVVLGATYYFSDSFGVNLEVGYPLIAKVSASFKF